MQAQNHLSAQQTVAHGKLESRTVPALHFSALLILRKRTKQLPYYETKLSLFPCIWVVILSWKFTAFPTFYWAASWRKQVKRWQHWALKWQKHWIEQREKCIFMESGAQQYTSTMILSLFWHHKSSINRTERIVTVARGWCREEEIWEGRGDKTGWGFVKEGGQCHLKRNGQGI